MGKSIEVIKERFSLYVKDLQNQVTEQLNRFDPQIQCREDIWQRKDFHQRPGGGGITRAFKGEVFENAGVNTSLIFGAVAPDFAKTLGGEGDDVWATGISLIIHPKNPKVPTTHANFRLLCQGNRYWFGGGADLTPYYPYLEDFSYFHQVWEKACRPYGTYKEWKENCDRYFTNHHRGKEMRGVGGIFFDHFQGENIEKDLEMVMDLGNHFINSYFPLVEKRVQESWTPEDEEFQLYRRGRYVEFNLIHDRGTAFGLKSNGRTESILISLPARCKFSYEYAPPEGSSGAEMMKYYYPKDWT